MKKVIYPKSYVRSSEYSPYNGKTYFISNDNEIKYCDDPKTAIKYWFQLLAKDKSRMGTAINTEFRKNAIAVCEAATPEYLTSLYEKYGCPYKLDYLIDEAKKQVANGCKYFYEAEGFGDMIHPFSVG